MNHPLRRKDGVRRIGISPEADAIACLNFVGRGPERFYDSDSLTSQKCWQFNFAPAVVESLADKFASALLNIDEVDASRVDSHQCFARTGNRRGQLLEAHHLRAAVRMNPNRLHPLPPLRRALSAGLPGTPSPGTYGHDKTFRLDLLANPPYSAVESKISSS